LHPFVISAKNPLINFVKYHRSRKIRYRCCRPVSCKCKVCSCQSQDRGAQLPPKEIEKKAVHSGFGSPVYFPFCNLKSTMKLPFGMLPLGALFFSSTGSHSFPRNITMSPLPHGCTVSGARKARPGMAGIRTAAQNQPDRTT